MSGIVDFFKDLANGLDSVSVPLVGLNVSYWSLIKFFFALSFIFALINLLLNRGD